jgi:hypothetical protein
MPTTNYGRVEAYLGRSEVSTWFRISSPIMQFVFTLPLQDFATDSSSVADEPNPNRHVLFV